MLRHQAGQDVVGGEENAGTTEARANAVEEVDPFLGVARRPGQLDRPGEARTTRDARRALRQQDAYPMPPETARVRQPTGAAAEHDRNGLTGRDGPESAFERGPRNHAAGLVPQPGRLQPAASRRCVTRLLRP